MRFHRLEGTGADDRLRGAAGNTAVDGGAGDDTLGGGDGGASWLRGGAGDDYLYAGEGAPLIVFEGGTGNDGYLGWYAGTSVYVFEAPGEGGGFGADTIDGFGASALGGDDRLVFAGYTEADLAGPVQTVMPFARGGPLWYWQFDFRDGSMLIVALYDDDPGWLAVGTEPVAGGDYIFV